MNVLSMGLHLLNHWIITSIQLWFPQFEISRMSDTIPSFSNVDKLKLSQHFSRLWWDNAQQQQFTYNFDTSTLKFVILDLELYGDVPMCQITHWDTNVFRCIITRSITRLRVLRGHLLSCLVMSDSLAQERIIFYKINPQALHCKHECFNRNNLNYLLLQISW